MATSSRSSPPRPASRDTHGKAISGRRFAGALPVLLLLAACADRLPTSPQTAVPPEASAAAAPAQEAPAFVAGRLIVGLAPGGSAAAAAAAGGAQVERDLGRGVWLLRVPPGAENALAWALRRNPNVEFAEPDYVRTFGTRLCAFCALTGDNFMGYKWDLRNDGVITGSNGDVLAATGKAGADLNWEPAFQELGPDFEGGVLVAILDSGIRGDHEDLVGRVAGGYNFYHGNANWADDDGHGTHVAGIVGARAGNGTGVAGIAWGPNVRFLAVKVCGPFFIWYSCTDSAIYEGINWAVAQGAKVINLSLGGSSMSSSVQAALQNAVSNGSLPVCAAGNGGTQGVAFPAAFPECVAVSATNWSDGLASYSSWGNQIELSAPGGDLENANGYSYVLSTYHAGANAYAFMAGTSMAAPQVSGLAALLYSQGVTHPGAVRELLHTTADDLGPAGWDARFGFGRINAGNALAAALGGEPGPPPPNRAPVASFSHSCVVLTCEFTDASSDVDGQVVSWAWSFGDGSSSTDRHPSHTYSEDGTYSVTLVVTDDDGATGQTSKAVTVSSSSGSVVADFSFSCVDFTCTFENLSHHTGGTNLLANWDLGDGSGMYIMWEPPPHTYAAPGSYEVIMVVMAEDMSEWSSARKWVTVPASPAPTPPAASFDVVCAWLACSFTDSSTPGSGAIESWTWDFGDESGGSTDRNPTHTYAGGGSYTIFLTVTDENGLSSTASESVDVQAEPAGPAASFGVSCIHLVCAFTDASVPGGGTIVGWTWDFGDGSAGSNVQSPSHTYGSAGTFTVKLTVTDSNGKSDETTQAVSVEAEPPADAITLTVVGYKLRGRNHADLSWSGASTAKVVIFRNGEAVATVDNDPAGTNAWTHATTNTGSATWTYKVCEADASGNATGVCSQEVQVRI